jgi:hypothetical protein
MLDYNACCLNGSLHMRVVVAHCQIVWSHSITWFHWCQTRNSNGVLLFQSAYFYLGSESCKLEEAGIQFWAKVVEL